MASDHLLDPVSEAAIGWMVALRSGATSVAEGVAFDHWLAADPRHRQAWQRLAGSLENTFGGPATPPMRPSGNRTEAIESTLRQVAARAGQRRRMLRGALGVAGLGVGSAWLAQSTGLLPDWAADLHTATGERRSFTLADGSQLQLDARSAVNIDFSAGQRVVHLRQGQMLATVAALPDAPFVVHTRHGLVRVPVTSPGARLMVRQGEERSFALALASHVALLTDRADGLHRSVLQQGEAAWFNALGVTPMASSGVPEAAAAWSRGLLQAEDQPLGEVVAALKPYRQGFIRISPQAARLRVTGVYALDDSDATLQALAETLPIEVHRHTGGWWVRVDMAA